MASQVCVLFFFSDQEAETRVSDYGGVLYTAVWIIVDGFATLKNNPVWLPGGNELFVLPSDALEAAAGDVFRF